jgi:hypothetical protein
MSEAANTVLVMQEAVVFSHPAFEVKVPVFAKLLNG